jgi:hypothetical protein
VVVAVVVVAVVVVAVFNLSFSHSRWVLLLLFFDSGVPFRHLDLETCDENIKCHIQKRSHSFNSELCDTLAQ